MPGSRRTPGGRSAGNRPSSGRPSSAASTTRRSTGPSSRTGDRSRATPRGRAGVETARSTGTTPKGRTASGSGAGSKGTGAGGGSGQRPGRPSVTGRAAVLALVVAVLLVSYAYPLRTWWEQRSEREALQSEADQLQAELQQLERELDHWDDPAFVAAQARERLGFVMPGEQGYVVIPEEDDGPQERSDGLPPAGSGQWYERLWSSVEAADIDPADTAGPEGSTSGRTTRGAEIGPDDTPDDTSDGTGGDDS